MLYLNTSSPRRTFLQQATAIATVAAMPGLCFAESSPATRIIDTHTHFYDPTRKAGVPWPGKGTWLDRPVYPQDWLAVAAPLGVQETVIVEASAWLEDNQWILDLAAKEKCVVGFVGNLQPQEIDFPKHLKRFGANPIFRGIRISGDFTKHVEQAEFQNGLKLLADMNLELDINSSQLKEAAKLAADYPTLRIVIDHVGSAGDAARLTESWRISMAKLGERKNVFCKVSALTEQTAASHKRHGDAPRDTAYYKPILDQCWDSFGPDRLIYGSNWPVCEKGGSFADQFKIASEYFRDKGAEACEKFFWKNSLTAYEWIQK